MLPLLIIIFTLLPISSHGQNVQQFNDCATNLYSCSETIRSIGYPFFGEDRPSYCGLPEFNLTCRDGITTITIIETTFRVLGINQATSTITIAPDDLWPESDACSLTSQNSITNNSFQQTVFAYIPERFTFLGVHLSCVENENDPIRIPSRNRLNCSGDEQGGRVSFFQNGSINLGRESCENEIIVPVLEDRFEEFMESETRPLAELLKDGFPVEYKVEGGGICSLCEESGGTCWSNYASSATSCLCPTGISQLVLCSGSSGNSKNWIWASIVAIIFLVFFPVGLLWYLKKRKARRQEEKRQKRDDENFLELMASESFKDATNLESDGRKGSELMLFSFASIVAATADFASENKLGEGGFGPVYKGTFRDEREIAIKRLSRTSGQGLVEFKNELILIAKLQHTNLVRILGCCIHGEEKMLIYEYMPNKSLDFFIFDKRRKALLDWPKRWNIIEGIAQGLLYLHKYSRMRVIHRDLKVSNVLLDENMNPKISDFGMARIFKQNETEAITKRVVGTYGYMSPEYAMEGTFSVKSDVFSFGVLTLEIVSGRRNTSFAYLDKTVNLIGYAWELWQQGDALEFEDPTLADTCVVNQLLRTIHVALLCVQENALDRPEMSNVISMLTNDTMLLPTPKRPAFFIGASATIEGMSPDHSINKMTITEMEGR